LKEDIAVMIAGITNKYDAKNYFMPFVDVTMGTDREPINLSNPKHMKFIAEQIVDLGVDLLIIDTVTAAFNLEDENSNAEVDNKIIKPLTTLARETNAAVWFSHHAGKPQEGGTREAAYFARGASAFGARVRTVFTLTRDRKNGDGYVVLTCAKSKGDKFKPVLLKLDETRRWFDVSHEELQPDGNITAQVIAEFIASRSPAEVATKDISQHFLSTVGKSTVTRRIKDALKSGLVNQVRKGKYTVGNRYKSDRVAGANEEPA
jgi:hypothetical protein